MFTYIRSVVRIFRSSVSARRQHELALLGQLHRNSSQERQARGIETRLFFDAELLASAQARQSVAHGFKKSLLACGAGLLLVASPMSGRAEESDAPAQALVEFSPANEEVPFTAKLAVWLEDLIGVLGEGEGDPADGDG